MEISSVLAFDLELTRDKKFIELGAVFGAKSIRSSSSKERALAELEQVSTSADFLLGHNIIDFDLPWLKSNLPPTSKLFRLPVIDTLFLSPIAYPKNPYHRLVKDYKLVRDTVNNPVADSQLALQVFTEQYQALVEQANEAPELIELYQKLFAHGVSTQAMADVFASLVVEPTGKALSELFTVVCGEKGCPNQLAKIYADIGEHNAVSIAYLVAWLQVAEGNSVLPPWVSHKYPNIRQLIKTLRSTNCGDLQCDYCRANFDGKAHLNRLFGLPDFRPLPDGTPLQQQIIEAGLQDSPALGILPTGGGKSLCFQLPALVRNERTGSLTVVVSPLQALMKDQVDNMRDRLSVNNVEALHGMLTQPERAAVLERIRMGDVALLYLSPEQLRNKRVKSVLQARLIGAWVFDEAHCLSKWGHDFRPDYINCVKVIRDLAEKEQSDAPPVFCLTATAKPDVIQDIVEHFKIGLNTDLARYEGGVERDNLEYGVVRVATHEKDARMLSLLEEFFGEGKSGSCVIYAASQKKVEEVAGFLQQQQPMPVAHYHAGLDAAVKRSILEDFIAGEYRIVVATNAFGMGIDKDDVRLVLHYEIPGSLENYLQEAGRAGRDREHATCLILFDDNDIEAQFKLTKLGEIRRRDISQILTELRNRARQSKHGDQVVITSKELLRSNNVDTSFDQEDKMADTKVKTALAWLERDGFVERQDNVTSVFQGAPLFATLEEVQDKLDSLQLSASAKMQWQIVLEALVNAKADDGLSADDLLDAIIPQVKDERQKAKFTPELVMKILAQMADAGLVSKGFLMTALVRPKGRNNALSVLEQIHKLERSMWDCAQDLSGENENQVQVREFASQVGKVASCDCSAKIMSILFSTWASDRAPSRQLGSISVKTISKDMLVVSRNCEWRELIEIAERRQAFVVEVLMGLYDFLPSELASSQGKEQVEFAFEQLIERLSSSAVIHPLLAGKHQIQRQEYLLKGIERSLLFLDKVKAIELQNGLAVFKQAMEIDVNLDKKSRYTKANFQLLDDHYHQKVVQVHVMYEYAQQGLVEMQKAMAFVSDYFNDLNSDFIKKYFLRDKEMLTRATSQASWNKIVTDLANTEQEEIVSCPPSTNQMVLAGPGSGKTKVIIHRIAFLLRVEQVPANRLLVLTYNHNAAVSLKRRLLQLIGRDAKFVRVHTYHGLALRLLGRALPDEISEKWFEALIKDATSALRGDLDMLGVDELSARSELLDGIEHILVDEYQDIDQVQYDLITELVGQAKSEESDRLSIMAVGDDDQSIYGFRHADVRFIRQFTADYEAETRYLTQNYRSSKNIITAANSLIAHASNRMKAKQDIRIDKARQLELAGGLLQNLDGVFQGKVAQISCANIYQQAHEVVAQIQRMLDIYPDASLDDFAVLARHGVNKPVLNAVRCALHEKGLPCQFKQEDGYGVPSVREWQDFSDWLRNDAPEMLSVIEMKEWLPEQKSQWHKQVLDLLDDWQGDYGDEVVVKGLFLGLLSDHLFELKRNGRVGEGVLLSTVHGVKGEEYKFVFVLDGHWEAKTDEELRLYYVALTRAVLQLVVFEVWGVNNSFIPLMEPSCCKHLSSAAPSAMPAFSFYLLGMQSMYIGFAGKYAANQPIHKALNNVRQGDQVELVFSGQYVFVRAYEQNIARLSKHGAQMLASAKGQVLYAKVAAVIKRHRDPENEYDANCQVESWYVPVIDVVLNSAATTGELAGS